MTLSLELHEGSLQRLTDEMAYTVYDELWAITGRRGALSLAGKMSHELRKQQRLRKAIVLDAAEEDSFWLAHEQMRKRLGTTSDNTVTEES